jgi:gluconolactonase
MTPMRRILFALVTLSALYGQSAGVGSGVGSILRTDPALDKLVAPGAKIEKVLGDLRFTEGPVWVKSGGYLFFSDVVQNAILKWTPGSSKPAEYRKPVFAGSYPDMALVGTNGLALDPQGRLVAAEHGNRRISRTEKNGAITVLADRYEGKRLNSPNDLVVKSNGDIYFTDPPGLYRAYPQGSPAPQRELDFAGVYRIVQGNRLELLTRDVPYPNGIAFSPDEKKLYVANSRPDKYWMVYDVTAAGGIANGRKFVDVTNTPGDNVPDGMKVDRAGNVYATGPAGVMVFTPQGKLLGAIVPPELPANCAWGDADGKSLYIAARTGVYKIRVTIAGMRR